MSTTSQPSATPPGPRSGPGGESTPGGSTPGESGPGPRSGPARTRTLERRLLGWLLALTVAPALIVLAVGGWALATSIDLGGATGPWEEVAESGRQVVERVEPADPAVASALAEHREALSRSLTQARRWAFLERRFRAALPWLVVVVALALIGVAYAATRRLARQLARPIEELVVAAEHLGRGEPLPDAVDRSVREVVILDRALRRAAADLEAARDRAVAAERLRVWGEMARRVAHEMKNPLTPLRFAAHRLARSGAPAVEAGDAGYAEAVAVIEEEVGRLEDLAAQFGSLGRPPEGPATEIDVEELLSSLLETDAAGVATTLVAPAELPPVLGHYDALFRAFRNVIRNGVEAMESVPAPRLDVELAVTADGMPRWLDVRIRDNGPGLPPGESERIFEPDFTTKTRGTGLGLALVRQAVTADGGSVTARSLETGAELVIRLPVMPPLTEQEPA